MKILTHIKIILICFLAVVLYACNTKEVIDIDLSGEWGFKIDSLDEGTKGEWFTKNLDDKIMLPGSMAQNLKGNDISVETNWTGNMWNDSLWYKDPKMEKYRQKGNVKVPFWLSPQKVYTGAAWYQKQVVIPKYWKGKTINLFLERVHWESTVWVDGVKVGMQNSLATPHNYNLKNVLKVGNHTITIKIDNSIKDINVGLDAHSISDNTQTNWNGIIGDIKLTSAPKIAIESIKLYTNITTKKVKVVVEIKNPTTIEQKVQLILEAQEKLSTNNSLKAIKKEVKIKGTQEVIFEYDMGENPKLWDEFNPNLYQMEITLESKLGSDTKSSDFGMRDFKADGTIFKINNRPVFLRGTLECAIFPFTGYPTTDTESWKRIFKIIKEHGLNHMRFHSWCPPEAAFSAADELGVYLQVEASAWTTIGDDKPIDKWLYKEGEDIINTYGNHPSFVMMAYGNEPGGKNHKEYLRKYVSHFKSKDPRRMYTGGAGWPYLENQDFFNHRGPRIQGWNENLESIINKKSPQTVFDWSYFIEKTPMPYVSHEMGQWCVYPNFKEMSKYTGVLKPKNFEIFKENLQENGMGDLAEKFLLASGKLQTLCYKADIEAALRTKNMAGFQLLDLHDFPGQGTALIGVLDAFWDEKGYVSPEEFKAFSGQTVPLARLAKRTFKNTDTLKAEIEIAHFGAKLLKDVTPTWSLVNTKNEVFAEGKFTKKDIKIGNGISLGTINVSLLKIEKAQKLTLSIAVNNFKNTWDLWVYPAILKSISENKNIKVVSKLDAKTNAFLEKGGNVLLNITKGDIVAEKGGDIGIGFSSIFWNTSWTKEQKPHTLGILCDPKHPALQNFPTEYHSNWQWWDSMTNSNAIILDDFPSDLKPIVRIIDDWFKNRNLALIFEAKVGKGKIIISGIDLHTNLDNRIEAKQLLYSLKKYMVSKQFTPKSILKISEIQSLIK